MGKKLSEKTSDEKVLRLLSILLFTKRKLTMRELTSQLECSKQTVSRIIAKLENFTGGVIYSEVDGNKHLYWMENTGSVAFNLDAQGLQQLILCRNFMAHILPEEMKNSIDTTLNNARAYVSERNGIDDNIFGSITMGKAKGRIDYNKFQNKLDMFTQAIAQKWVCRVTYKSSRNKDVKTYCFAAVNIIMYHDVIYIRGWVVHENGEITLKYDNSLLLMLHRVQDVSLESRKYNKMPELDNGGFGVLHMDKFKAKVKFSNEVADYVSEREWSTDQTIEECENGIVLTFSVSSLPELISWVLSFGAKAELLEPEWLRKELAKNAQAMVNSYEEKK